MSTTDLLNQQPTTINQQPTTDSEVLVRVENVSKKFCRSLKRSLWYGVKDIAHELNPFSSGTPYERQSTKHEAQSTKNASLRTDEFWAVNDVSFELRRGECLGLIGHNGAGKTTLLKMLNGLIKPDRGRIEMRGRVGALIALGAGFNPILTGRENVYVNASVLGLTKREIDEKLEEIIDFAEIGEFIDAPVQSYSSGMQVRLGFAVATAMNPDILILDEVLAVGDMRFQAKCLERIGAIRESGAALLFVSHNMHQMSVICDTGLVLSHGCTVGSGRIREAISIYQERQQTSFQSPTDSDSWATEGLCFQQLQSSNGSDALPRKTVLPNEAFTLDFAVENQTGSVLNAIIDTRIVDSIGTLVQATSTPGRICIGHGRSNLSVEYGGVRRHDDQLKINVAIWSVNRRSILAWLRGIEVSVPRDPQSGGRESCKVSFSIKQCH